MKIVLSCFLQTEDSLVYEIETVDIYKDFYKDKICLILAAIDKIQKFLILSKKKGIGKMKDEFKGKIISEFVGLKSRMYLLIDVDYEESKKAKGVNKKNIKNIRQRIYLCFV